MFPYITFILLIIFIIIFLIYTYKIGYQNRDNFKNNINNNKQLQEINYLKYNTDLTKVAFNPTGNPLDYMPLKKNYNYTTLYYLFLIQLFQALSVQKIDYKKKLINNYPKSILDSNLINTLDMLVKPLLKKIKQIAPMTDFWLVGYESYDLYQIKNSNLKLHRIDCFLYDVNGVVQIRLLLEIVEEPKKIKKFKSKEPTCAQKTTPSIPYYYIGYPCQNQLIPLPSQVIVTGRDVLSEKGTKYPVPCPYEKIWVNYAEIVNSSLVLNAFENFGINDLPGLNQIPINYSVWKGGNDPYYLPSKYRNRWTKFKDEPKNLKAWPCTPIPFVWNLYGTPPAVYPTKDCPGLRRSTQEAPLTTSYDPSMFDNPRNTDEYNWLFSNSQNTPTDLYHGSV